MNQDERRATPREIATAFILSLPKFEGMQQASPEEPEKYKLYRELIDKLEAEIRDFALWYHKEDELRMYSPQEWSEICEKLKARDEIYFKDKKVKFIPTVPTENPFAPDDVMPDDIRDQVAREAKKRFRSIDVGAPHRYRVLEAEIENGTIKLKDGYGWDDLKNMGYIGPIPEMPLPETFFEKPKPWSRPKPTLFQRIKNYFRKG